MWIVLAEDRLESGDQDRIQALWYRKSTGSTHEFKFKNSLKKCNMSILCVHIFQSQIDFIPECSEGKEALREKATVFYKIKQSVKFCWWTRWLNQTLA